MILNECRPRRTGVETKNRLAPKTLGVDVQLTPPQLVIIDSCGRIQWQVGMLPHATVVDGAQDAEGVRRGCAVLLGDPAVALACARAICAEFDQRLVEPVGEALVAGVVIVRTKPDL